MADYEGFCDPKWPPGTVKLTQLLDHGSKHADIILQPRPTNDPNDPLNWPRWQKAINYGLACFYAMMVYAFVNATSPTWGPLADELGFDNATLTNTYAIGCATLAVGAPMLIPFALKFGSRVVYLVSSVAQFAISIWAARTMTAGDWWGVNALQCWIGALCEVLIQLTIADMYFVHERGVMNAGYIWIQQVGSNLAIVAAGFVTQNMGWRWVWWWFVIFFGVQVFMFAFGFEETKYSHKETLAERQGSIVELPGSGPMYDSDEKLPAEKQAVPESPTDVEAGDMRDAARKLSMIIVDSNIPRKPYWKRLSLLTVSPGDWSDFFQHSWQPFLILFTIPGVTFCSLVYAILFAWQNVETALLSTIMLDPPYNFTAAQIGLMNLAPFIGSTIGTLICGPVSDWVVLQLAKRNDGIYEPEMRFWVFLPFIPFTLAGTWWFGYALNNGSDWSQIAVAWGMAYFGTAPLASIALTYMLDAYNDVIGDALTALTSVRNTFATIFVFAIPAWSATTSTANIFNTLGGIGIFILAFTFLFIWKGKYFRVKTARLYKYYADRQFETRSI